MGKLNVDAVGNYSSRYKKKSLVTPTKKLTQEEEEATALAKRLSLEEYETKEAEGRAEARQRKESGDDRRDRRGRDSKEKREREVTEARLAKLPVTETFRDIPSGGREVVMYDDSKAEPTRKWAADESETTRSDPAKKQRTAWAPDYHWQYDYGGRDVHISTDSTSCAELFRKIHVGPSPFFGLQDMYERTAFTDAAKKTVAVIS